MVIEGSLSLVLWYCVTLVLRYCGIVLLFYCVTLVLCYSGIVLLWYCVTVVLIGGSLSLVLAFPLIRGLSLSPTSTLCDT